MVQVSSKYRPRLLEIDEERRRRLGGAAEIVSLDGALRNPRSSGIRISIHTSIAQAPRR